ncbi:hypothetical protein MSAN_00962300 [Mycena sanguinolenta]|uniref:Uncharacterized protein n=1 Tax=Mycena sanguinolenta TaxID=230812 RepID=A0A8H7DCY5_9AGAR|nr:hypothetical protein MSAN_00962300 [Mycena sanguinolenta]
MQFGFNTSTAGILPTTFDSIDASAYFPGTTEIPGTVSPYVNLYNLLTATSSTTQQGTLATMRICTDLMPKKGFSAVVDWQFQDLSENTSPSLSVTVVPLQTGVNSLTLASDCGSDGSNAANTTIIVADLNVLPGSGSLAVLACPNIDRTYSLILQGTRLYSFMQTMVCTFIPQITNVNVESTFDFFGGTTLSTKAIPGGMPDEWGAPSEAAVTAIADTLYFAQAVQTNIMGDQIKSIIQNANGDLVSPDAPLNATQDYLRGVAEYSGSVFRACLSAGGGGISADGVPESMTKEIFGRFDTQFFGWEFTLSSSWVLIPGTLVAMATFYVVRLTLRLRPLDPRAKPINAANTMQLITAAAAGGLRHAFTGTADDKKMKIGVGVFDGVEPAFIKLQAIQYS